MENLTLSDIAAVTRDTDGFGGGNGAWWIIILFLFMFGNGNWGGGNSALTRTEMQQGFDTAEVTRKLDGLANGLCDSTYALNTAITTEGRAIQTQLADCCCNTRLGIAEVTAQNDRNTCAITTAIHAEGEATRALIRENEIQALRDKVQALELNGALCGVVRYPMQTTYNSGGNPFCGCGCNNNI